MKSLLGYFGVGACAACVDMLWRGVTSLRLPEPLAKLTAIGLVFFWNYAARRYHVFSRRP